MQHYQQTVDQDEFRLEYTEACMRKVHAHASIVHAHFCVFELKQFVSAHDTKNIMSIYSAWIQQHVQYV